MRFLHLTVLLTAFLVANGGEIMSFDQSSAHLLPPGVPYSGNILEGRKWEEKTGTNVLLITEVESGSFCEKGYKSELRAYKFLQSKSQTTKQWEIKDYGENECSKVNYLPASLTIKDIDGDSVLETIFMYEIGHDCCDPLTVKLMLHVNNTKLPIRGKVPMTEDSGGYTKQIDKAFDSFPSAVKKFASDHWDSVVKKHYGSEE